MIRKERTVTTDRVEGAAAKPAAGGFPAPPTGTLKGVGAVPRAGSFGMGGFGTGEFNTQAFDEAPDAAGLQLSPETPLVLHTTAIPINPTVYSAETVIIQNSITINVGDPDVRELKDTLGRLVTALEGINELSAEVRRQLSAEINAGKALLEAPKVERNAIQLYLLNPLRWIGEKVAAVIVTQLATRGLELLLKLLSGS
jgi:hypothetical protein